MASVAQPSAPAVVHNRRALFWICVLALLSTAISFSIRTAASDTMRIAVFEPIDPMHSGQLIGIALGAVFSGWAVALLAMSPLMDVIGFKRALIASSLCYIGGTLLTIGAPSIATGATVGTLVTGGIFLTGIGWGCTEAAINPMTAALYPDDKTHRLNVLHAWWPGGIVIGGLLSVVLFDHVHADWRIGLAVMIVPSVIFGLWALTQDFPKTESAALGVGFREMIAVPFRQPSFWIFFGIMFLTASSELAPASWVDVALTHTVGMKGIVLLVYMSAIMFVMRHFAGPIAHRLSDIGLLWISALPACVGLYLLSIASSPLTALVAATIWGAGVAFMWPTMLAAVAHRYPRGGPWTIGLAGFAGAMSIQLVLPELGAIYDAAKIREAGGQAAFAALAPGPEMDRILASAAAQSFQTIALIPLMLIVIFGALFASERRRRAKRA